MSKDREIYPLVAESHDLEQREARHELDPAACGHLQAVRGQRGIVAERDEHPNVRHRARRPRVERKAQHCAPSRTPQLGTYNDQPVMWIEGETHRTTAVFAGILPVYSMANRLGRSSTAFR